MMNKENLVNGNTVLAPQRQVINPAPNEKSQEAERKKKESLNRAKKEGRKEKLSILRNIAILFGIGVVLIGRYSAIYHMQKDLSNTRTTINRLSRENESLKVDLVKASNIQNVEEIATTKLHMIPADKNKAVYADLTKENFKNTTTKNQEKKERSLMEKIKNILF